MEWFRAINPIIYRYLAQDRKLQTELSRELDGSRPLELAAKLDRLAQRIVIPRLEGLEEKLTEFANQNKGKKIPMRVDGQHEGTISIEEVFTLYANRLRRRINLIKNLQIPYGGFALMEADLNDRISDLAYQGISAMGVEANIAADIRHGCRSELGDFSLVYDIDRVGSSTMPHKRNPADYERVVSLWKAYMPRIVSLMAGQITEHQGDSTNEHVPYTAFEILVALAYTTNFLKESLSTLEIGDDSSESRRTAEEAS